jgi:hypothetical protein
MMRKFENSLRRGYLNAKSHAHHIYHGARSVLKKVDYGVDVFRRTFQALRPALADYPETTKQVKRALNSYDQVKQQATGLHNVGEAIVSNVRKTVPELF